MQVTITKDELYTMIKKAVRDVIHEEKIDFILRNARDVSQEEMSDIEDLYGKKPPKKITIARSRQIEL